jgi:hypothetical protein
MNKRAQERIGKLVDLRVHRVPVIGVGQLGYLVDPVGVRLVCRLMRT